MSINDCWVAVMPVRLRAKNAGSRVSAALVSSRDVGGHPDCDSYPNLLRSTYVQCWACPFFPIDINDV